MNRAERRNLAKSRNPRELAALAERHHLNGRLDKAEQKYREAIALNPGYVEAHNNLGMILQERGRVTEATAQFVRTFEICPTDARIVFNLARALSAQHQCQEAAVLYRQAVALSPYYADAHFGLGLNLAQLGDYGEAEHSYRRALQLNPRNWQARINLGLALVEQGKVVEAYEEAEILARAENEQNFPHKSFGILLARAGCPDGARACFETHLLQRPADEDEVAMLLATVGGALPERAPGRHVEQIYAAKADMWDRGAAGEAGYQGHRLVTAALEELCAERLGAVIDLGCGTGLVGELLRARADQLIGVDLSEPMLAQARQKKIYDRLHRADLQEYLAGHAHSCDIIASAATLIHFGDLDAVFSAAAKCLRDGGLFAFTLFPNDDDPEAVAPGTLNGLAQGGCFRHGRGYVTRVASSHGFDVALSRNAPHEYVAGSPIEGMVVVLRKVA